jgi:hypothetical protein
MYSLRPPATTVLRQTTRLAASASKPSNTFTNHTQRATYASNSKMDRSAGPPLTNPLNIPKWYAPSQTKPNQTKPSHANPQTNHSPPQARNQRPPPQTPRQQLPNLQRPPNNHDRRRPQRPHRLPHQQHPRILLPAQRPHAPQNHRAHDKRVPRHLHQ